ncbi:MAG: hypothetical protein CL811_04630 [Colwelliaceae bacterium]|nr:hypothetical protein [Colwelliaceae bacterium]|tara:strand:+ start:4014 stop:4271 length:258 start_codon:yes stop_codon:yes gene_type:complete
MYKLFTANNKAKKRLRQYIKLRPSIKEILDRLRENPRKEAGAHPLHGRLKGKWGCWLGSNIRVIYTINDKEKSITIQAVGSHKIY